ncbi:unnamed protein product [Absidia cylindrospora]
MITTYSCPSTSVSDTKPIQRLWRRISNVFRTVGYHRTAAPTTTPKRHNKRNRQRRPSMLQEHETSSPVPMSIPPYSPTYCQPDRFPYSNFYIKLPDGRWMVRFRDGNRGILRTDIIHGNYI